MILMYLLLLYNYCHSGGILLASRTQGCYETQAQATILFILSSNES
ncbi:hypothetical protein BH24BAC1_BH24BAC1_30180 [soil metagenome]|jgi:hypothetical protein